MQTSTRKSHRRFGLSVLAAVLGVSLVASSGSASAADALDKIKESGKITVGTEAAFPPFEFVEDGKIVGFGKDILDYIVADLGVELVQLDVPFQGIFPGLLARKFDLVATTLVLNEGLAKKFAFTAPIAEGSSSIVRRTGDTRIKSTDDLSGKVVGTQLGTGSEKILRTVNEDFKKRGMKEMDLKLFTSSPESFLALANRQLDAATSLLPMVKRLAAKQPDTFEVVARVRDRQEYIGWITRPEDTRLRDYLNTQIKELRDSGKLYELQEKWFGFQMEVPGSGYMPEGGI